MNAPPSFPNRIHRIGPLAAGAAALCLAGIMMADIHVRDVRGRPGQQVSVTVEIGDLPGLAGVDLQLSLPEFAVPGTAVTADLGSGFLIASRARPGAVHVAMARGTGLEVGSGALLTIPIRIDPDAPEGAHAVSPGRLRLHDADGNVLAGTATAGELHVMPPAPDMDSDGLDDDWEVDYFQSTTADGEDDDDGDGASNRHEFLAGTDPTSADSLLFVRRIDADAGADGDRRDMDIVLEWDGRADREYEIHWSDGPLGSDMTWRPVYNPNIPRNDGRLQWTDNGTRTLRAPTAVGERFYRIMVKPDGIPPVR